MKSFLKSKSHWDKIPVIPTTKISSSISQRSLYIYIYTSFENPSPFSPISSNVKHFYASKMRDTREGGRRESTRSIHPLLVRRAIEPVSDVSALHRLRNIERPRSPPPPPPFVRAIEKKEEGDGENARAGTPALFQGVARGYVDTWRSATSLSSNVIPFDEWRKVKRKTAGVSPWTVSGRGASGGVFQRGEGADDDTLEYRFHGGGDGHLASFRE